jgi:uncharacterized membrane protein YeaQ/YmgE (transglycosylase-associated protein family)
MDREAAAGHRGPGMPAAAHSSNQSTEEISMLGLIVSLLIIGLIAGAIARLVIPGKQDLSILATIGLGVVGSFVGGFIGYLLFRSDRQDGFFQPSGIFGSIIGSIIVLLLWLKFGNRARTRV